MLLFDRLSYLGYLGSEKNSDQIVGWAYMSWSLLSCVSIVRRARQSLVRKIQNDDEIGTQTVRAKIRERVEPAVPSIDVKKDEDPAAAAPVTPGPTKRRNSRTSESSNNSSDGQRSESA